MRAMAILKISYSIFLVATKVLISLWRDSEEEGMKIKRKFEKDVALHETFLEAVPTSVLLTVYWMSGAVIMYVQCSSSSILFPRVKQRLHLQEQFGEHHLRELLPPLLLHLRQLRPLRLPGPGQVSEERSGQTYRSWRTSGWSFLRSSSFCFLRFCILFGGQRSLYRDCKWPSI